MRSSNSARVVAEDANELGAIDLAPRVVLLGFDGGVRLGIRAVRRLDRTLEHAREMRLRGLGDAIGNELLEAASIELRDLDRAVDGVIDAADRLLGFVVSVLGEQTVRFTHRRRASLCEGSQIPLVFAIAHGNPFEGGATSCFAFPRSYRCRSWRLPSVRGIPVSFRAEQQGASLSFRAEPRSGAGAHAVGR